jgi:hypothetical protein
MGDSLCGVPCRNSHGSAHIGVGTLLGSETAVEQMSRQVMAASSTRPEELRNVMPTTHHRSYIPHNIVVKSCVRPSAGTVSIHTTMGYVRARRYAAVSTPYPLESPCPLLAAHCTTQGYAHCIRSTPYSKEWRCKMPFDLAAPLCRVRSVKPQRLLF